VGGCLVCVVCTAGRHSSACIQVGCAPEVGVFGAQFCSRPAQQCNSTATSPYSYLRVLASAIAAVAVTSPLQHFTGATKPICTSPYAVCL
jgi:hypothetical protein